MQPSGGTPAFTNTLRKDIVCDEVWLDKMVMVGKFYLWDDVQEAAGGAAGSLSLGEPGANLQVLQRAAGNLMILSNPSVLATDIPMSCYFVAAHIGSTFAFVLPLIYAEDFQKGVMAESPYVEDLSPTVKTLVPLTPVQLHFFKRLFEMTFVCFDAI